MCRVDNWITDSIVPQDDAQKATLANNASTGLPTIDVSPNDGKMLYLLAKMNKAKRILEVGTLGGYSALWFAKAVPEDGKIVTLELDPESAAVAAANIQNAGFEKKVEIKVGPAVKTLEEMSKTGTVEPFDMVFIDADKGNNPTYFKRALEFSHVGSIIVVDNVVRRGRVVDPENDDTEVAGIRKLFEILKTEKRVECTALQTVGSKGWDGFALAVVIE
ncbi:O-methyltransferase family protein [Amylocarpus encephaloides]|uniref:O-methyltransferase family protein n=1 Tax=Amylocarpus encephaloides TaxID=45428 RepID=A0A9P7YEI6_9HELO|nr:O-methyltransferase family protein [Amylocarpus encephaloides]